jgi:hypothetical protein
MSQHITDFFIPIDDSTETPPSTPQNLSSPSPRRSPRNHDNSKKKYVLPKRKRKP